LVLAIPFMIISGAVLSSVMATVAGSLTLPAESVAVIDKVFTASCLMATIIENVPPSALPVDTSIPPLMVIVLPASAIPSIAMLSEFNVCCSVLIVGAKGVSVSIQSTFAIALPGLPAASTKLNVKLSFDANVYTAGSSVLDSLVIFTVFASLVFKVAVTLSFVGLSVL